MEQGGYVVRRCPLAAVLGGQMPCFAAVVWKVNYSPMFIPALRRLPSISTLIVLGPMVAMMELLDRQSGWRGHRRQCCARCLIAGPYTQRRGMKVDARAGYDTHVLRKYLLEELMACSSGLREAYHSSWDSAWEGGVGW